MFARLRTTDGALHKQHHHDDQGVVRNTMQRSYYYTVKYFNNNYYYFAFVAHTHTYSIYVYYRLHHHSRVSLGKQTNYDNDSGRFWVTALTS